MQEGVQAGTAFKLIYTVTLLVHDAMQCQMMYDGEMLDRVGRTVIHILTSPCIYS